MNVKEPDPLTNLLVRLVVDPALRSRFERDPQAVVDEAGLSAQAKDAVLRRDPEKILEVINLQFSVVRARRAPKPTKRKAATKTRRPPASARKKR